MVMEKPCDIGHRDSLSAGTHYMSVVNLGSITLHIECQQLASYTRTNVVTDVSYNIFISLSDSTTAAYKYTVMI